MAGKKRDGLISGEQWARVPVARIYLGANEAVVLGPLPCPNNFEGPLLHFVFAIVCDVSLRCSPKSCKWGLIKPGPTSDLLPSLNSRFPLQSQGCISLFELRCHPRKQDDGKVLNGQFSSLLKWYVLYFLIGKIC